MQNVLIFSLYVVYSYLLKCSIFAIKLCYNNEKSVTLKHRISFTISYNDEGSIERNPSFYMSVKGFLLPTCHPWVSLNSSSFFKNINEAFYFCYLSFFTFMNFNRMTSLKQYRNLFLGQRNQATRFQVRSCHDLKLSDRRNHYIRN